MSSPMRRTVLRAVTVRLVGLSLCMAPLAGLAQDSAAPKAAAPPSQSATTPPVPPPAFHPSMGDLMTLLVQPRHIKLGLAGRAGNWSYAAYEVGELRGAFRRVGQTMPVYNKQDFVALIAAMTTAPIAAVQAAIKQRDRAGFQSAYAQLTAACNACHVSEHHSAVVIRIPVSSPYVDQEFRRPSESR